ncbi:hypothetical protein DR864_25800 [Runella rosea]|uniref:Por secretion system C-terminal sorting domain-containing protein n=2 Tax=Runella TaxID=105 RepID=A0A344TQI9_9BACT|nr:hypothetical protein DR864_25800 [Runella rosea]
MFFVSTGNAMAESHLFTKDVKIVKRDAKKVEVRVNQPNVGILDVELRDKEGVLIYEGEIKGGENVATQFNLNALPSGEYTLNCFNNNFWSSQQLSISNGNIEINENSYKESLAPKVEMIAINRFEVSTVVKNVADMEVIIADRAGEVVYKGYLSTASRFNLGHLPSGEYSFEFVVADKSFKQFVNVK